MGTNFGNLGARRPTHYIVQCKLCQREVPSGCLTFPLGNIVVECPLCGEKRRYRPAEVFLGFPHHFLNRQQLEGTRRQDKG